MCGIVGSTGHVPIAETLLQSLFILEYRGYDSAGIATVDKQGLHLEKQGDKVSGLAAAIKQNPLPGNCGIAHTRWATHGKVTRENAHPHISKQRLALVHNGIIENHNTLRQKLQASGYVFESETDSEVIVHLIDSLLDQHQNLCAALIAAVKQLQGDYALAVISRDQPEQICAARRGSPLAIGLGEGENFVCSDALGLRGKTDRFIYLEEGDFAEVTPEKCTVRDTSGKIVEREILQIEKSSGPTEKGKHPHFMHKEIFEQPQAVMPMLKEFLYTDTVCMDSLGDNAETVLAKVAAIHIVACGTSYHAGLTARYWLEEISGLPCSVEIASEYRYRRLVIPENTLLITISQSGETADTLASLRYAKKHDYLAHLAICNVAHSSLIRESGMQLMTEAGAEIGVASTKSFTAQLTALLLLCLALAPKQKQTREYIRALHSIPELLLRCLELESAIKDLPAQLLAKAPNVLFLGRGVHMPIMMEGALKFKELSYIHAEAYPGGELKHGPMALIEDELPVIAAVADNHLREKMISNLEEISARGGKIYIFAESKTGLERIDDINILDIPTAHPLLSPFAHTIPLQLLAYHAAVHRGHDVDQPRNLAKSVTVE